MQDYIMGRIKQPREPKICAKHEQNISERIYVLAVFQCMFGSLEFANSEVVSRVRRLAQIRYCLAGMCC